MFTAFAAWGRGGWVPGVLAAVCLAGCLRTPAKQRGAVPETGLPTTVIILRHAERLSDGPDTPLSEAGQARARALVPLLTALNPDVVIVSGLQRTRQTVAPFLEKTNRVPLVRSNEKCADLAAEILKSWRGRTVLVAWHRGPHAELAKALGAREPFPNWKQDTYDRYWIISVDAAGAATLNEKTQEPVAAGHGID